MTSSSISPIHGLRARGVANDARLQHPLEALRRAVPADRQRRRGELQQAHKGNRSGGARVIALSTLASRG